MLGVALPGFVCAWHALARVRLSCREIDERVKQFEDPSGEADANDREGDLEHDEEVRRGNVARVGERQK